jgi:hypothetical protein
MESRYNISVPEKNKSSFFRLEHGLVEGKKQTTIVQKAFVYEAKTAIRLRESLSVQERESQIFECVSEFSYPFKIYFLDWSFSYIMFNASNKAFACTKKINHIYQSTKELCHCVAKLHSKKVF